MTEEERSALQQATQAQYNAVQAQYAQQSVSINGVSTMAGGGAISVRSTGALGIGSSTNTYQTRSSFKDAERRALRRVAMSEERNEIVKLIQSMADEVGAPTLLHAVVLAINVRDYPEE